MGPLIQEKYYFFIYDFKKSLTLYSAVIHKVRKLYCIKNILFYPSLLKTIFLAQK